jgi:accessory gene regulator protein AgrB
MTFNILSLSALILIMAFVGLFIHINSGGLYETKTIGAMIFRIIVTLAFVLLAYLKFIKNEKNN